MAQTTINADGTITVDLSPSEQELAKILLKDKGADAITEVFNLWFSIRTKDSIVSRFESMPAQDKTAILATLETSPVAIAADAAVAAQVVSDELKN